MLTVVSYCTEPDCRCLDRDGVIEYCGPDERVANEAIRGSLYPLVVVEYQDKKE